MKLPVSPQSVLALVILIGGGTLVGGEYLFVRWYPAHKQRMADQALTPVPYRNTGLGISLDVAKGICEKTEILPGEVRLSRPGLSGGGPSLTSVNSDGEAVGTGGVDERASYVYRDDAISRLAGPKAWATAINGNGVIVGSVDDGPDVMADRERPVVWRSASAQPQSTPMSSG